MAAARRRARRHHRCRCARARARRGIAFRAARDASRGRCSRQPRRPLRRASRRGVEVAWRRLRATALRTEGDRGATGRLASARSRRAAMVSGARRAGAAAVRPARARALLRARLVAAERARRRAPRHRPGGVRTRARARDRRRSRRAQARVRSCGLALAHRQCGDLVRPGLGAGWRRRARRPSACRPGAQSGPGRRRRAGFGDRRARVLARHRRRTVASAVRAAARRAHIGDAAHYRRFAPFVRRGGCTDSRTPQQWTDSRQPHSAPEALAGRAGARHLIYAMKNTLRTFAAFALAACLVPAAFADEAAIRKNIAERLPNFPKIDEVTKTAIPGLYELRLGSDIRYTDEQGTYLIEGDLVDLRTRTNLTEQRIAKLTAIDFKTLPLKDAMVWKQGTGARKLVVFADPNCGYCKKFERDLQAVKDVTVYTFLYPILGNDSPAKSKAIWCAKDNTKAWRDWMLKGTPVNNSPDCDTAALQRNFAFGKKHRINGTPGLVFEDGSSRAGAMDTDAIEKLLAANRGKPQS